MKSNTFEGMVRINKGSDRYEDAEPYLVEVWDDEANERAEDLERSFAKLIDAQGYAKALTGQSDDVPVMDEEKPSAAGYWYYGLVTRKA